MPRWTEWKRIQVKLNLNSESGQGHSEGSDEPLNKRSLKVTQKEKTVWVSISHQGTTKSQKKSIGGYLVSHVLRGQNKGSIKFWYDHVYDRVLGDSDFLQYGG